MQLIMGGLPNDQTIFENISGPFLPTVQGGNGYLAFGITLYGEGTMRIGGSGLISGNWTTSYVNAVPEPQSYVMIFTGLALLTLRLRKDLNQ